LAWNNLFDDAIFVCSEGTHDLEPHLAEEILVIAKRRSEWARKRAPEVPVIFFRCVLPGLLTILSLVDKLTQVLESRYAQRRNPKISHSKNGGGSPNIGAAPKDPYIQPYKDTYK
jgi:hypothetical protein